MKRGDFMRTIDTVCGSLPSDHLGRMLMHEHVFCVGFDKDYSGVDRRAVADRGEALFGELRRAGYASVLDATPWDLGRDLALTREISLRTGVEIIVCAGTYHFYHSELDAMDMEAIAGRIEDAFDHGFGQTGIRPGAIKCAVQDEISPYHAKLLRAAARAHRRTGLPIISHTAHPTARALQQLLLDEGVNPRMLIVGHVGDYDDGALHEELLQNGTWLGLDRSADPQRRGKLLARLCAQGFADRLMLSQDRAVFMDFSEPHLPPDEVWRKQDTASTPEGRRHFLHLDDNILSVARALGVTQAQIDRMQIENPRRFFEGI